LHPWQEKTRDCGLPLHGALDLSVDVDALQAEFAALDRDLAPGARSSHGGTQGWTAVSLLECRLDAAPEPTPALAMMPSVAALLPRVGAPVHGCYLLRQGPGDVLKWHFDSQALHLEGARVLIPIAVPPAAITWIGHEPVAYPVGRGWAGDFAVPHQVENPSSEQRVMLAMDLAVTPALTRLFPPALSAEPARRAHLALECRNLLLMWRAANP
jgi:hypothetical protein